jgi:hypothetical protein
MSEQCGSEHSLSESVRAASAHVATLRSLLVSHISDMGSVISDSHDAGRSNSSRLAGATPLPALHVAGRSRSAISTVAQPHGHSQSGAGGSMDGSVQALLADQSQLLDLVRTLITDHRTSLLEQRRLQQQLSATQSALHEAQLDADRAVALAELRCAAAAADSCGLCLLPAVCRDS